MKRIKTAVSGAVLAATLMMSAGGCASDKKNDEMAANRAEQKYKILSGSTSDKDDGFTTSEEPSLNVETRFAAGQLAEANKKWDCAVVQYQQALILQKNHVPSLYRLGILQTRMEAYDQAATTWKKYIKATGGVASGYSNLGYTYEMAGDVRNAEKAYKEGLVRDPKCEPCRINYGLMLARQNRTIEAEVQLAAALDPDEVAYNLAAIYEQQGSFALAKAELRRAIEANPKNTAAMEKLATLPQD